MRYQLLTDQRPFDAESVTEIMTKHMCEQSLRSLRKARVWLWLLACACASSQGAQRGSGTAPAAYYAAESSAPTASANSELARFIRSSAEVHRLTLAPDARLDRLAQLAAAVDDGLSARQLEFEARKLGLYDPRFVVLTQPVPERLTGSPFAAALTHELALQRFTHYGAIAHDRRGQRSVTLVLSVRPIRLGPLPSSVPVGTPLRLRGRLPDGFKNARVELIDTGNRVIVPLGAASDLSVQLPATRPGLHRVAVLADGARGAEVLAKLPIYVGMAFPRELEPDSFAQHFDEAAVAERVFASINRERAKASLPPLRRDPRLDSVALQHSTDMRDHDFLGHSSPQGGDPKQRVARAGLPTSLVLETIARAGDPAALEASGSAPAGELRNMLSRSVTHVGLGIVVQQDAHGPILIATELFVELPEPVELASATPQLLSLVNEARVKRAARTVVLDSGLSAIAAQAAERFVRDASTTQESILADTDRELGRFSLAYRRVHGLLVIAQRLQDVATLEPVLDPEAAGLGIGIARGERGGASVMAVVLLVGTRR
ncbi:MAG: CAP domain-containing protein [Polyangiales bacterium]